MAIRPSALPPVTTLEVFHKLLLDTEAGPTNSIAADDFFRSAPVATETDAGVASPSLVAKVNDLPDAATLDGALGSKADAAATTTALAGKADAAATTAALAGKASTDLATAVQVETPTSKGLFKGIDSWLLDIIRGDEANIRVFGADNAGTAYCDAAMTAAVASLPLSGRGTIYVPPGVYKFNSRLAFTNRNVRIRGAGAGLTIFTFDNAASGQAGLYVTQNNILYQTQICGLSLYTSVAQVNGSAAIRIQYPTATPGTGPKQAYLHDIEVGVPNDTTNYWANGIELESCSNSTLLDINIHGRNEGTPAGGMTSSNMLNGVKLTGYSIAVQLIAVNGSLLQNGYYFSGDSEGAMITGGQLIGVNYGTYLDDGASSGDPAALAGCPGPLMVNVNFATYKNGVLSKGWNQTQVNTSTFYKRPESNAAWVCFDLREGTFGGSTVGSNENKFKGNQIYGFTGVAPGTAVAVKTDSLSEGNIVSNNSAHSVNNFYDGSGAATTQYILNNTASQLGSGWVVNGSGNKSVVKGNWPVAGIGEVASNGGMTAPLPTGATPHVGASNRKTFFTTNVGATNVTNFLNAQMGEVITLIGNDGSNTTLTHNATLLLLNGFNVTLADGRVITFEQQGASGAWREISRS